jgi:cytochrome c oxidase subunit III
MLKESLHLVPARRDHYQAKMLFVVFIASLGMFFLAALSAYVIIRRQSFEPLSVSYLELRLPVSLWLSTLVLLATSFFLERACWFVRRQLLEPFQKNLIYAAIMSVLFVLIQSVGLEELYRIHFAVNDGSHKAYGMSFTLAFVHILHVLGGVGYIGYVIVQSYRGRYDHERFWAVKHCAGYWHFLDVVWIAMLVTFIVVR